MIIDDQEDAYQTLERLHEIWATATEATEAAWRALSADSLDQGLRNDYFAKQDASNSACQDILDYRKKAGV